MSSLCAVPWFLFITKEKVASEVGVGGAIRLSEVNQAKTDEA